MRVRLAILAICLGLLSGCTMWKQPKSGWSGATGGEQLVRLWWEEVKAKRASELEKRLAATYVGVMPEGVVDRAGALQRLSQLVVKDYTLGEFVTQSNGPDLVVAYRVAFTSTLAGQSSQVKARVLSVWQETKSGWIMIAETVTPDQAP